MCSKDLTDSQIAQIVHDVERISDIDKNGDVEMDEFTHFLSNDECDLRNVIEKYKEEEGDPKRLEELQKQEMKEKEGKRLQELVEMHGIMEEMHERAARDERDERDARMNEGAERETTSQSKFNNKLYVDSSINL